MRVRKTLELLLALVVPSQCIPACDEAHVGERDEARRESAFVDAAGGGRLADRVRGLRARWYMYPSAGERWKEEAKARSSPSSSRAEPAPAGSGRPGRRACRGRGLAQCGELCATCGASRARAAEGEASEGGKRRRAAAEADRNVRGPAKGARGDRAARAPADRAETRSEKRARRRRASLRRSDRLLHESEHQVSLHGDDDEVISQRVSAAAERRVVQVRVAIALRTTAGPREERREGGP